jgi:hypothetical protein
MKKYTKKSIDWEGHTMHIVPPSASKQAIRWGRLYRHQNRKKGTPWGPLGVADPAGLGTSPPLKAQGHTDVGNPLGTPDKESRCGQGFNVEYKQSDECQIWMDV